LSKISVDISQSNVSEIEVNKLQSEVSNAHDSLHSFSGLGSEFTGWLNLPDGITEDEITDIERTADKIRKECTAFVVVGIGGSYLGSKAVINALKGEYSNYIDGSSPKVFFAGNSLSERDLGGLLKVLQNEKDVIVNVISKSGRTIEPALSFRILRDFMVKKYGRKEAARRIYASTDPNGGILREMAIEEGYKTFPVPENIGGRYSVLTAVGLLPIAVSGIDIRKIISGARVAAESCSNENIMENEAYKYAAVRKILYDRGKRVEILANFEPRISFISEWWKQLFGESEGKEGKGIFPASVNYSTDLHSLGQYVQDGSKVLFETFINMRNNDDEYGIEIPSDPGNLDQLEYLSGKRLSTINKCAFGGTRKAHTDGGVENIVIEIDELNEESVGGLLYFFMKSCAVSGYLLGVNPFDQPGVEAYKNNMMDMIGKLDESPESCGFSSGVMMDQEMLSVS
jgi:glucose-6-phosphate isomerase